MIEKVYKYAMQVGAKEAGGGFQTYFVEEDGKGEVRYEDEEILAFIEENGIEGELVNR